MSLTIAYDFLRGLADTDFCITFKKTKNNYPCIKADFASEGLVLDISKILLRCDISHTKYIKHKRTNFGNFTHYAIEVNGCKNLGLWLKNIGFRNQKHLTKIALWKKQGYCSPRSTYKKRFALLEQKSL